MYFVDFALKWRQNPVNWTDDACSNNHLMFVMFARSSILYKKNPSSSTHVFKFTLDLLTKVFDIYFDTI